MKSKIAISIAMVAGATLLLGAPFAWADGSAYDQQQAVSASLSEKATDPTAFLQAVNAINWTEIQMGQLAQERGQTEAVRKLGEHMIRDHKALEEKVKSVASEKNIQLAAQLDAKHQKMVDELSALSGISFDRKYVADQINGHQKAISLFQQAASSNRDPGLRRFADNTIPQLQHHLQMAEQDSNIISEPAGAERPGFKP